MIPARDIVRAVPAQAPAEYANVLSPWEQNDYGLDLGAGRAFVANSWWRARSEPAAPQDLLSSACTWGEIDYARAESPNLDGELHWRIERPGTLHGLYVWFDGEVADGFGYSNAPHLPELVYGRAFFPLLQATDVVVGDQVTTRMSATLVERKYVFRWNTRVTDAAGSSRRFQTIHLQFPAVQSTETAACRRRLRANVESRRPDRPRGNAGNGAGAAAGRHCRRSGHRFPERFPDARAALNHVATLSLEIHRYRRPGRRLLTEGVWFSRAVFLFPFSMSSVVPSAEGEADSPWIPLSSVEHGEPGNCSVEFAVHVIGWRKCDFLDPARAVRLCFPAQ